MRLSATEAIHRGLLSVRANWELVIVLWVQSLVLAVIFALSLLPPLAVLGIDAAALFAGDPEAWAPTAAEGLAGVWADVATRLGALLLALVSSLAIGTLGFLFYCFVQGGVLGVLMAADRQCVPGPPPDWRLFRTFSLRSVIGWGRRYLWRYFWLFNLFLVFYLVWTLILLCLVWLAVWAHQRWGGAAAAGFGCGGALPLIFGLLILGIALTLAQADLAREDGGVMSATRRAVSVLGARPAAVVLILVLTVVAGLVMGLGFGLLPLVLVPFTAGKPAAGIAVNSALTMVQWLAGSAISLAVFGSFVALVRNHRAESV
jgi:hypothetical protein